MLLIAKQTQKFPFNSLDLVFHALNLYPKTPKKRKHMKKNPFRLSTRKRIDTCARCGKHFRHQKVKIIWKDVVECTACGLIWVLEDVAEWLKWT